ncbi:hypothetical protein NL676_001191 [Syzygium grande]|nr:hypothetical protein NL676_001191 [Syzygium grande]
MFSWKTITLVGTARIYSCVNKGNASGVRRTGGDALIGRVLSRREQQDENQSGCGRIARTRGSDVSQLAQNRTLRDSSDFFTLVFRLPRTRSCKDIPRHEDQPESRPPGFDAKKMRSVKVPSRLTNDDEGRLTPELG